MPTENDHSNLYKILSALTANQSGIVSSLTSLNLQVQNLDTVIVTPAEYEANPASELQFLSNRGTYETISLSGDDFLVLVNNEIPSGYLSAYAKIDPATKNILSTHISAYLENYAPIENGKVPIRFLPSYVDEIVTGWLSGDNNGHFDLNHFYKTSNGPYNSSNYIDVEKNVPALDEGDSRKQKIYVDNLSGGLYRWSGGAYVSLSDLNGEALEEWERAKAGLYAVSGVVTSTSATWNNAVTSAAYVSSVISTSGQIWNKTYAYLSGVSGALTNGLGISAWNDVASSYMANSGMTDIDYLLFKAPYAPTDEVNQYYNLLLVFSENDNFSPAANPVMISSQMSTDENSPYHNTFKVWHAAESAFIAFPTPGVSFMNSQDIVKVDIRQIKENYPTKDCFTYQWIATAPEDIYFTGDKAYSNIGYGNLRGSAQHVQNVTLLDQLVARVEALETFGGGGGGTGLNVIAIPSGTTAAEAGNWYLSLAASGIYNLPTALESNNYDMIKITVNSKAVPTTISGNIMYEDYTNHVYKAISSYVVDMPETMTFIYTESSNTLSDGWNLVEVNRL